MTPLMIDNTLYVSTMYTRVVALDAGTGTELWAFDPRAYEGGASGAPPGGFKHRGVAVHGDGEDMRIFLNSRDKLYAIDAKSGELVATFGDDGQVVLTKGFPNEVSAEEFDQTSPPVVFEDLVIVGSRVPDRIQHRFDTPGSVQAFDVHTGERRWVFFTVPQSNDSFGADTWEDESWRFTGHANVWGLMSLDTARGLLYVPTPTKQKAAAVADTTGVCWAATASDCDISLSWRKSSNLVRSRVAERLHYAAGTTVGTVEPKPGHCSSDSGSGRSVRKMMTRSSANWFSPSFIRLMRVAGSTVGDASTPVQPFRPASFDRY